jgi:predicted secreted protein
MAALAGRHVRISIGATAIAGAQVDEMTINREHIDITDKDDEGVRHLLDEIGTWAMDLTCSGIVKNDAIAEWSSDPQTVLQTLTIDIDGIGSYTGDFGMTNATFGGNDGAEAATFSASFSSSGAIAYTAAGS